MTVFIIRRLMQAALVIFVMSVIVFIGISVVSNPIDILINPDFTQEEYERAVRALGLDRPLYEQYFVFLGNALQGNLGDSFVFGQPALELIAHRIPATMELAFGSLFLSIVLGIPLGVYAGLRPDSRVSKTIMAGSIFGFSLPSFWVGIMLIMIFAVELGWLPSTGRGETVELMGMQVSFLTWDGLQHLFLPALNLALVNISLVIRVARAGTREAALQDYVRFARAKGLSSSRIVLVHILKNIMIPIVTILGLELGSLIAFSVVTETIFAWPGMGKLLIDSINVSDRPIVVAYLMLIVCIFVVINLIVDVLYSVLDPRVRLQDVKQ
ncbi:peptide/nickel transport system permease protein [Constrictibacter sp. MBR-5]|jgi:peptide/nickel transport system permease protein|uniref:ABC transporter permease n=1 Tax=Constrictibacter sp. MBR-5 TaxID=3156467 RepID=UPI0033987307